MSLATLMVRAILYPTRSVANYQAHVEYLMELTAVQLAQVIAAHR